MTIHAENGQLRPGPTPPSSTIHQDSISEVDMAESIVDIDSKGKPMNNGRIPHTSASMRGRLVMTIYKWKQFRDRVQMKHA
jgi:hypothetical protein